MLKIVKLSLENDITFYFVILIFAFFIVGIIFALLARFTSNKNYERYKPAIKFFPTAMSTIGVIGTFLGIFIGLIEFDVSNIDESVPHLLAGLKIAFATSIFGMFAALLFRGIEHLGRIFIGSRPVVSNSDDPIHILNKIVEALDAQTKALVGDNEYSLVTIMQKNRQEIHDGFKDQISSFNEFAEQMKEGATEKIVEALKDAIVGFNEKISEQFGDNFKQLNSAVGNLNEWQQNYKTHLEHSEEVLRNQALNFEKIGTNMSVLSEEAKSLPQMAETMKQANSALLQNFASMNDLLESLSKVKTDAENVLPQIENSMNSTTKIMENATQLMTSSITNTSQTMEITANNMAESMKQTLEQTQKGINSNFETFDQQMQSELIKVLELMGTQLTSLSDKFVKDYTPLTDQLQRLMHNLGNVRQ